MTASELISLCYRLDIRLWAEDGRLKFDAPKGVVTPELRAELVAHKAELVEILANEGSPAEASPAVEPTAVEEPESTPAVRPQPEPVPPGVPWRCLNPFCLNKSAGWWLSVYGVVNCRNCRGPSFLGSVAAQGDLSNSPMVDPDRTSQAVGQCPHPGAEPSTTVERAFYEGTIFAPGLGAPGSPCVILPSRRAEKMPPAGKEIAAIATCVIYAPPTVPPESPAS